MGANGPEIRIGLVLYGGVSLAVYIYGVVLEVQRLLRAANALGDESDVGPAYARALARAGTDRVTVDIVSGTSAGGINGILLAKALACGGDVERARDLWLDGGDIDQLLQPPSVANPRALLQSSHFEARLEEGLRRLDAKPRRGALWPPPVLDLFVPSTHLRGGQRRFSDSLGTEIETRQHRYVFRLKLRRRRWTRSGPRGYNRDDFRDNPRLSKLARATSAFPVAFEPVLIEPDDGLLEDGEEASGWFADGGILNNKPFSEAIETIFRRSSTLPVRRWLFSVDPDPVTAADEAGPGPEPAFDQIAVRSVAAIPRYQSIARDLADLEAHNERVLAAEEVVRGLEAEIDEEGPRETDAAGLGPGPAAAYEVMRRQAWALELADLMMSTVRGVGPEVDRAAIHRALRSGAASGIETSEAGPLADLALQRRRIYYLIKLLGMAVEVEEGDPAAARDALWAEFERISDALDATLVAPAREAGESTAPRPPADALRGNREMARARANVTVAEALPEFALLGGRSFARLEEALAGVRVVLDDPRTEADRRFALPLADALGDFERRDAMLLSAEVYGGLRQRDRIRHAQISPVAADNTGVEPERRLAGASLGHFGGFLDRDWRRNDLMWGRLDGAEVLIRAILEDGEGEATSLVDLAQMEVLADELPEVLRQPGSWKRNLRDHMGDGPSPVGLDGGRMVGLGLRAAAVVRRMLRTAADTAEGGFLNGARAFAMRAIANGIGFLLALVYLPAKALTTKGQPLRRVFIVLALLPTLWGLVTLVLGILDVLPLSAVLRPALIGIAVYPIFLAGYWALAYAASRLRRIGS
jgi:predicted acylesterase/phospholipase RssA